MLEFNIGLLKAEGYDIVDNFENSDIVILNSCTVKNPSQEAFITLLRKAREHGKLAIAAGCVPQGEPTLKEIQDCSVVGVTNISRISEVIEETAKGHIVKMYERKELPQLNLPKIRKNAWVEILPLSTGCLGQCTFCKTRQARGTLMSYDMNEIISRAKQVLMRLNRNIDCRGRSNRTMADFRRFRYLWTRYREKLARVVLESPVRFKTT